MLWRNLRSNYPRQKFKKNGVGDATYYTASALVTLLGLTYAAVPLYRVFCQTTGFGGTVKENLRFNAEKMRPNREHRKIKISFNADTAPSLLWKFFPEQKEVFVSPGETSLVFYKAFNPSSEDIIGISTYNVYPPKCGAYFNKIQCFCFEEQRLRGGEEVDMPVFFFIDPEFAEDPLMAEVKEIVLSYTFFNSSSN
jgi:cytochrome c oxidase assembly protein subunit 11